MNILHFTLLNTNTLNNYFINCNFLYRYQFIVQLVQSVQLVQNFLFVTTFFYAFECTLDFCSYKKK
jgi:hypothetical protein